MQNRIFFVFIITFIFLISYSYLLSKYPIKKLQETPKNIIKEEEKKDLFIDESKEELLKADIGNFIITYSPKGGYIKNLFLKKYNENLLFKNIGYIPEEKDEIFNYDIRENGIIFKNNGGKKKEFIFDGYKLQINLNYPNNELLIFSNHLNFNILEQNYQEIFTSTNSNITHINFKKIKDKVIKKVDFLGARDRYFCISLLSSSYSIRYEKNLKGEIFVFLLSPQPQINLYIGPQSEKELERFGLQDILNSGFLGEITLIIRKILYFLYFLTKNWGISIILLTIIIYILLFPFTLSSTKAMKKIAEIQPILNELREKYKDNIQKYQKEQIELFKKYRINPLGGCLPLLFQIPIFFALFQLFSRFIEFKEVGFLWIKDLTLPDRAFKLPFNLPYFGNYINILPILMLLLNIFQQKLNPQSYTSKEQQFSSLFLLGFISVLFYHFSSSLLIYWLTQSLLTFMYQFRQFKIFRVEKH